MFAKYDAIQGLKAIIEEYKNRLETCEDEVEKRDLIDVVENLEWVVKELSE